MVLVEEKELKKSWKNCTARSARNACLAGSFRLRAMSRSAHKSGLAQEGPRGEAQCMLSARSA